MVKKTKFKFQNQDPFSKPKRKELLTAKSIKKILAFSSFLAFFSFLVLRAVPFFYSNKSIWIFSKKPIKADTKATHVFPLLVNLKGREGPQLARVQVSISFNAHSLEKDFLSSDNQIKKHLLFILSGQSTQFLKKKKDYFEEQIQSQLNAFVNQSLVRGVQIQTEVLN